jgi:DNA-binding CsgD family transcriptional regulator
MVVNAMAWQASMAMSAGDWDAMRAILAAGLAIDPENADLLLHSAALHLFVGEAGAAEEDIQRLVGALNAAASSTTPYDGIHMLCAAVAMALSSASINADRRREPELVARAKRIMMSSDVPPAPVIGALARFGLAMQAFLDNDAEAALGLLDELGQFRGTVYSNLLIDYSLGLLLVTVDRVDEAVDAFETGLRLYERGYRTWYVIAAHECARVRLERGKPGDHERARTLLDECLAMASELGMKPLVQRVRALQESLASPRPSLPGGLSEREAEVLRLMATGKTNGEIAEALVISPHTVGRHVSNIFDKLGITHRADAAAWAVRNGLVE